MNLSSVLVILLVIIFFSFIITFSILKNIRPSIVQPLTPKSGNMSNPTQIGTPGQVRDLFLSPAMGTILVYIRFDINNKTLTLDNNDPIRILQLGNALQLQLNLNKNGKYSTKLVVRTQGETTKNETISLLDFPRQKWVHLAIVREGRRYTVFYNGKVAGSDRTQYFPTINSSPFILGEQRLSGIFTLPRIIPTAYRIKEIEKDLHASSDTRHKPYMDINYSLFTFGCPGGLFCFSASSPLSNPLQQWKTPYA
jgi:hypothetical protein